MLVASVGVDSEIARLVVLNGKVAARAVGGPSNWASECVCSNIFVERTRGEEVVRYPVCDGWVVRGCEDSWGLHTTLELEPSGTRNGPAHGQKVAAINAELYFVASM